MPDNKSSKEFAERLRRIEQKRRQSGHKALSRQTQPEHENHDWRNIFIWLAFGIILGTGGYIAWHALSPHDPAVAGVSQPGP
ncbi:MULTISPECIES: hypothetical protein [unclassified Yoonia]|uniref:hypothetical protein n=1 Tax=unclassified Yoonia TaxID=2629118 RepID=UPI002AFE9B48|nr:MULTISPECIES: hypothetical protein [unclassified Yoonia]